MKLKQRTTHAPRVVLYGAPGTGKSTLAAASGCVVVDLDNGLGQLDCPVLDTSLSTLAADIRELANDSECNGVAIDTADALERQIWQQLVKSEKVKSIEQACGGYGKAYIAAAEQLTTVLDALSAVAAAGKNVLVTAHAVNRVVHDPLLPEHDRAEPRLHKHAVARLLDWADVVGYATIETSVDHDGRARSSGKRFVRVQPHPAALCKTRFGADDMLPLSWDAIAAHCGVGKPVDLTGLRHECAVAVDGMKDEAKRNTGAAKLEQATTEEQLRKLLAWAERNRT